MLQKFIDKLLRRKPAQAEQTAIHGVNNEAIIQEPKAMEVDKKKSWFADRYEILETQRNILFVMVVGTLVAVIISVLAVGKISISKSFSPFVIQIEERTGSAKIVNPAGSNLLSGNEAMARYFIKKYLIARETYNPVDFEVNAKKTVRLFSAAPIYRDYLSVIRNPSTDPSQIYGQRNTTTLKVKSFQKLRDQFFVRFSVIEASGAKKVFEYIATITVDFLPMELTEDERDINPIGFQITGYRVDDDKS